MTNILAFDDVTHIAPVEEGTVEPGADGLYPTFCRRRMRRAISIAEIPWDDLEGICKLCLRNIPYNPVGVESDDNLKRRA